MGNTDDHHGHTIDGSATEAGAGAVSASHQPVKMCTDACVGVLIADDVGRLLMFERATPPVGVAPVSGHVFDEHDHGDVDERYEAAARDEVSEEVGLTVTELRLVVDQWADNWCRRPSPSGRIGHQWRIYRATVTGNLAPSERETRHARWLTPPQVQTLADRTVSWALGEATPAEFAAAPGIEPIWMWWLSMLQLVTVDYPTYRGSWPWHEPSNDDPTQHRQQQRNGACLIVGERDAQAATAAHRRWPPITQSSIDV